jgi:hypothetical protein
VHICHMFVFSFVITHDADDITRVAHNCMQLIAGHKWPGICRYVDGLATARFLPMRSSTVDSWF